MSRYDYMESRRLESMDFSFASIIMGAIRKADDVNLRKLEMVFPELVLEMKLRYNARGGYLKGEENPEEEVQDEELQSTESV